MELINHLEVTGQNLIKNESIVAGSIENRSTAEDVVGVRFLQLPLTINNQ
jgi:hypothetical protein